MSKPETAGLAKDALKRLLVFARDEPIQAAFAIDGDGKAILQLDKRKPGRALEKALKEDDPESKNHRWGTASVEADDPTCVKFVINKAGSGFARKLVVALKGTGYKAVKLSTEDGTPLEAEEDTEDAGGGAPEASGGPAPAAPAPDGGASPLGATLASLLKQLMPLVAEDPAQRNVLKTIATRARTSLEAGDGAAVAECIAQLKTMLDQVDANPPPMPATSVAKVRQAWVATFQKVEADLDRLHAAVGKALKGHGQQAAITESLRRTTETLLGRFDDTFERTLDDVNAATDPAERIKRLDGARTLIARYRDQIGNDPNIALLDENPFTPLRIGDTLKATFTALSKALS